jgi:ATP-binding cassette subfamily F protein 3
MSLITAKDLSKSFGAKDVFSNISLSVPPGARIAIVGPNGVGKTTLLRLLMGLDEPTAGRVQRARHLKIGYLPQETEWTAEHTLWDECLNVFEDLRAQEAELAQLEAAMSDSAKLPTILSQYGRLQQIFEQRGGYTYELRIRQVLTGLGFDSADYHRPIRLLSGGQRTRALLARILLANPHLLILDEPTNHLDVSAVEWLEGYLASWEGSVLLVSHDRYFLDKVVNHIWELSPNGLEVYRGNYSAYLQQRQEQWELRQRLFEEEKDRLEKELEYIRRNIAGQNTAQAKGRLKRLSRQLEALERGGAGVLRDKQWALISQETGATSQVMSPEEATQRLRALKPPMVRPPLFKVHLKVGQRSGNIILRASNLVIGYPGKPLFTIPEAELRRLECAAILGPNGAGKTTFLKTLLGQLPPLAGELKVGASLHIGYFAQAHEDLDPNHTLFQEIERVAPHLLPAEIRSYLGRFLFSGDDVFRTVSTLSGGERSRLALAKLSLYHANLLLLDEPTNQLDIPSQEILQEVLGEFQGTIILVSHDRYLIEALATQIWEIDPTKQLLRIFKGSYSEYRAQKEIEVETNKAERPKDRIANAPRSLPSEANLKRKRALRLQEVEAKIAELEQRLSILSKQLEAPPSDIKKVQRLGEEYQQIQTQIEQLLEEWERLLQESPYLIEDSNPRSPLANS